MLRLTDRYVLSKLLMTLIPTLIGASFLLFVGGTYRLLREQNLSLMQVALALPWIVPYLLPFLLPLALAIALGLVFGRLVADREISAFSALGVSWRTLARPTLYVGALLSLISVGLTTSVVPYAHQKRKDAMAATTVQLFNLGEGEHLTRSFIRRGFDLYVREYGPGPDGQGELRGIVLHKDMFAGGGALEDRRAFTVVAQRGRLGPDESTGRIVLELEDVTLTAVRGAEDQAPPIRIHLERYRQSLQLGGARTRIKTADFSSRQLRRILETQTLQDAHAAGLGSAAGASRARATGRRLEAATELALRAALAIAPVIVALLVVPLCVAFQSSNALIPFAGSLAVVVLLFFAPTLVGTSLAESARQPLFVFLGWLTSGVGAVVLVRLADRAG